MLEQLVYFQTITQELPFHGSVHRCWMETLPRSRLSSVHSGRWADYHSFILIFEHCVPPFFEFWLAPEIPSSQNLQCIFLMPTAHQQSAGFSLIMALQFLFRAFRSQAATPVCLSSTLCSEPGHPAAYEPELSSRSRIPREQMEHTLSASTGVTLPPAGCRQIGVLSFDPLVTPTHCCTLFAGWYKFNRYPHRRSPGALTWLERVV